MDRRKLKSFGPAAKTSVVQVPTARAVPDSAKRKDEVIDYSWSHAFMHYLPNEARREAEENIRTATSRAEHWREVAAEMEQARDRAEALLAQTVTETNSKVRNVQWQAEQRCLECEERVRELEQLLERERQVHAESVQNCEQQLLQEKADCAGRIAEATKMRTEAVAAADARAIEAEERAEAARRRADADITATRERQQREVEAARRAADEKVRRNEEATASALAQMSGRIVERERQAEEALKASNVSRGAAVTESRRHVQAMQQELADTEAEREAEHARKESRLEEWRVTQRRQNGELSTHNQELLTLERRMHGKTMQRTMARVTQHLIYNDGDVCGRSTPTREILQMNTPRNCLSRVGALLAEQALID